MLAVRDATHRRDLPQPHQAAAARAKWSINVVIRRRRRVLAACAVHKRSGPVVARRHKTGLKDAGLIASQDFFERANEALAEKS
jgi:hypothetical protein